MCTGSVHKLCLPVALHQASAGGRLDLAEQTECPPAGRTPGPTGLAAMLDPVRMSLLDIAYLMAAVSDNAAADVLLARVGLEAVNHGTARLGLTRTRAVHTFGEILTSIREDAAPAAPRRSRTRVSSTACGRSTRPAPMGAPPGR